MWGDNLFIAMLVIKWGYIIVLTHKVYRCTNNHHNIVVRSQMQ